RELVERVEDRAPCVGLLAGVVRIAAGQRIQRAVAVKCLPEHALLDGRLEVRLHVVAVAAERAGDLRRAHRGRRPGLAEVLVQAQRQAAGAWLVGHLRASLNVGSTAASSRSSPSAAAIAPARRDSSDCRYFAARYSITVVSPVATTNASRSSSENRRGSSGSWASLRESVDWLMSMSAAIVLSGLRCP